MVNLVLSNFTFESVLSRVYNWNVPKADPSTLCTQIEHTTISAKYPETDLKSQYQIAKLYAQLQFDKWTLKWLLIGLDISRPQSPMII